MKFISYLLVFTPILVLSLTQSLCASDRQWNADMRMVELVYCSRVLPIQMITAEPNHLAYAILHTPDFIPYLQKKMKTQIALEEKKLHLCSGMIITGGCVTLAIVLRGLGGYNSSTLDETPDDTHETLDIVPDESWHNHPITPWLAALAGTYMTVKTCLTYKRLNDGLKNLREKQAYLDTLKEQQTKNT